MIESQNIFLNDVRLWSVYHATTRRAIIYQWERQVVRTIHLFSRQGHVDGILRPLPFQFCETWRGGLDSCLDSEISEVIS